MSSFKRSHLYFSIFQDLNDVFLNDLVHIWQVVACWWRLYDEFPGSSQRISSFDQLLSKGKFAAFSVGIKGRKTTLKKTRNCNRFQCPSARKYPKMRHKLLKYLILSCKDSWEIFTNFEHVAHAYFFPPKRLAFVLCDVFGNFKI